MRHADDNHSQKIIYQSAYLHYILLFQNIYTPNYILTVYEQRQRAHFWVQEGQRMYTDLVSTLQIIPGDSYFSLKLVKVASQFESREVEIMNIFDKRNNEIDRDITDNSTEC